MDMVSASPHNLGASRKYFFTSQKDSGRKYQKQANPDDRCLYSKTSFTFTGSNKHTCVVTVFYLNSGVDATR